MPRRRRKDLEPTVWLNPPHPLQSAVNEATARLRQDDDEVIIRKKYRIFSSDDLYITIYHKSLKYCIETCKLEKINNKRLDDFRYDVFFKLTSLIGVSKTERIYNERANDDYEKEYINGVPFKMVIVGCRVQHEGISKLAEKIGVSKSILEKQLRLFHQVQLVRNSANVTSTRRGFIEFDAGVVWRGRIEHRVAYLKVQRASSEPLVRIGPIRKKQ